MVKCYYDLHIHTGLSPCADKDMSPNNIVNMAVIKGLDIIAITDHNSAKNVKPILKVATNTSLVVIPGIEVETKEGIHLLCYFRSLEDLNRFTEIIDQNLPDVFIKEEIFGAQLIYDENDEVIDKVVKMLSNSTLLSMNEVIDLVHKLEGIVIPSHIDRYANSIITVLGFIPPDLLIDGVEISKMGNTTNNLNYKVICNSDAHYLGAINERINFVELENKSIDAFFKYFGDK